MKKSKILKQALKFACDYLHDYEVAFHRDENYYRAWSADEWYAVMIARAENVLKAGEEK